MAAWLGLVPRQYSTGDKPKLLGISKRGNKRLRYFFVHGARAVLSRLEGSPGPFSEWLRELRSRKPFNVVLIAWANKLARIAWAVLHSDQAFDGGQLQPRFARVKSDDEGGSTARIENLSQKTAVISCGFF